MSVSAVDAKAATVAAGPKAVDGLKAATGAAGPKAVVDLKAASAVDGPDPKMMQPK